MSYCEVRYEHFKREDSTNSIIVTLFDDDQVTPIVPNSSHSWSAKVAKEEEEEKYVGEYPVQIHGNEIILTSDRLVRLPRGTYLMELWENNNGKVTIYPSADFIQFTIHKNATDTMGHVDPTIDINKIIDDLHKAGQNIKLGTVTTGAPGSSVIIRQRLENGQNLLDFTIPRGADGATPQIGSNGNWIIAGHDTGKTSVGRQGDKGDPPTLRVGSVTKVAPGGNPTASVTGSNGNYSLNLGIPEGQQGTGFNWTRIPANADLNDYKQSGYFSAHGSLGIKNVPQLANSAFFILVVFSDGDTCTQMVADPNTSTMYIRGAINGNSYWKQWNKLGGVSEGTLLSELISILSKGKNVLTSPINWSTNGSTKSNPSKGITRFTAAAPNAANMGGYWYYDTSVITPGDRYIFQTMVRGKGCILTKLGEESEISSLRLSLVTEEWQPVNFVFRAKSDITFYSDVIGDDGYFELDDSRTLIVKIDEMGNQTNKSPNLFPGQGTPTFTAGGTDSTQHLSAQRFSYIYDKECGPKTFVGIRPLKGDTIFQSCIIRISDGATLDSRITFSFFNNRTDHYAHHVVPTTITPIGQNEYRLSASYQITEDDFQLKLMDLHNFGLSTAPGNGSDSWIEIDSPFAGLVQSGGVTATNLLQPVSFTNKWGATLTNGISHHNKSADDGNYYDDIHYNISSFEPSTHYRLSFVAWGSGSIQTLIYPGAALAENGKGGDGQKTWSLNARPTEYSYEFDSLAALYGDSQKQLLFRIPSDKVAVDFSLDTSSVMLEKVGG